MTLCRSTDSYCVLILLQPGLLAVKPKDAATVTDQTMTFSYIVGYTRPYSQLLQTVLVALLSLPVLETVTQTPIRANFFISLGMDAADAAAKFPIPGNF